MSMHLGEIELRAGQSGDEVKRIQTILTGQGYNVGPIDGIFGPLTQTAVQAFQRTKNLVPDGIVGPLTWDALQGKAPAPAPMPEKAPAPRGPFAFLDTLGSPVVLMVGLGAVALLAFMGKRR